MLTISQTEQIFVAIERDRHYSIHTKVNNLPVLTVMARPAIHIKHHQLTLIAVR